MGGNESGESGSTGDNNTTSTDFSSSGVFSWIAKGFENIGNFLASIVKGLGDLLDWLNPFSENFILTKIINGIVSILEYLNPFSDKFFGNKIIELLKDALSFLFVPSEERLNAIPNTVKSKFAFIESIKIAINSIKDLLNSTGNPPVVTVNVGSTKYTDATNVKVIDMSWYAPYKPYGDLVATGFAYAFFIWYIFINIPGIIMGSSGTIYTTSYTVTTEDNPQSSAGRLSGGRKLLKWL